MATPKTWFITGCSTGLGRALAQHLIDKEYNVVATARNIDSIVDLAPTGNATYLPQQLDVRNQAEIDAAVAASIDRFGQVDVVVNNAGYGLVGNLEGMSDVQIRDQFETNFFGALAVTRAFLPHMRAAGGGHFLHISSIAGFNAGPGGTIYSATKFALEGLSEGLHKEGAAVGIKSTIVEPGPFRTDWAGRSLVYAQQEIDAYKPTVGVFKNYLDKANGNQKGDPARAAAVLEQIALMDKPPIRIILGAMAHRTFLSKLNDLRTEVEGLAELSLSADYPS